MKKNNFWWGVLGFFFPLVGLILFIVWNKEKKEEAKASLIGAISGFVVSIIVSIIMVISFVYIGNKIYKVGKTEVTSTRIDNTVDFSEKEQKEIENKIKQNTKINTAKIEVKGKIIYITLDVVKSVSVNEAKEIVNSVLDLISTKVKDYYDFNYIITKNNEEGNNKEFPIMGYKNRKSDSIIW